MERCIQGAKTLSLPMQMLGVDLKANRVIYNNNPVLKWCLTNTGIQTDRNGNIVPVKNQSPKQRIDGTASLLICELCPSPAKSCPFAAKVPPAKPLRRDNLPKLPRCGSRSYKSAFEVTSHACPLPVQCLSNAPYPIISPIFPKNLESCQKKEVFKASA